jgi:catechol 2,3-dioxygenase-like lactoylglutathione lyase family enzyme
MIQGVHQIVIEVADQDRALDFWTQTMSFELAQDAPYGDERWLEVRTPDEARAARAQPAARREADGARDAAHLEHPLLL